MLGFGFQFSEASAPFFDKQLNGLKYLRHPRSFGYGTRMPYQFTVNYSLFTVH